MWTSARIGILSLLLFSAAAPAADAGFPKSRTGLPAALAAAGAEKVACPQGAFNVTAQDPELRRKAFAQDPKVFSNASVLVGVDVLGRVLAAIDVNGDGHAERFLKFTDQTRIEGSWSRQLQGARVALTRGSAVIESSDGETVVAFAVEGADLTLPKTAAKSTFVYPAGTEFISVEATRYEPAALAGLDYNNVDSWPIGMRTDFHGVSQQTGWPANCNCLQYNCDKGGGCSSDSCNTTLNGNSCNTSCNVNTFACCKWVTVGQDQQVPACQCIAYSSACFQ